MPSECHLSAAGWAPNRAPQDGKADVEPFEAITLLLEHIGPYIRKSAHTTKGLGKRTGSGLKSVKSGGVPADAFVPDEAKRAVLDT